MFMLKKIFYTKDRVITKKLQVFMWLYTVVWLGFAVLLIIKWNTWPSIVTWPLAIFEAIFTPDIGTLKKSLSQAKKSDQKD